MSTSSTETLTRPDGSPVRVLVVDDEQMLADLLASALRKLEAATDRVPMAPTPANQNVAAMMIANPFRAGGLANLFSTHPPMEERIARLERMAGY